VVDETDVQETQLSSAVGYRQKASDEVQQSSKVNFLQSVEADAAGIRRNYVIVVDCVALHIVGVSVGRYDNEVRSLSYRCT
jgi:hypothetical protein